MSAIPGALRGESEHPVLHTGRRIDGPIIRSTLVGLQVFEPQFKLLDLAIELLRLAAELHTAQGRDDGCMPH